MLSHLILGIFTFVQLNCENLFDCTHDSLKQDTEYCYPGGVRRWTGSRYGRKLKNIAKEIIACSSTDVNGNSELPDMVALCEIENDSVVHRLTRGTALRGAAYGYLTTQSPDVRGIDVALLYSPSSFRLIRSYPLRPEMPRGSRPTRDILYAAGELRSGDTLHVFVVHAPSRYGGKRKTEPRRMAVAERLLQSADSIRALSPGARIIIAGDFNDETGDRPLMKLQESGFADISARAHALHGASGTYKYKGRWQTIDHILVSPTLQPRLRECIIQDSPFLLEADERYGGTKPRRTYNGYRYLGGYSDHLPLVARFGTD